MTLSHFIHVTPLEIGPHLQEHDGEFQKSVSVPR